MITIDFNRLHIKSDQRILDIGCGTGRHLCAVSGFDHVFAIGVDLDFQNLAAAQKRLKYHKKLGEYGGGICKVFAGDMLDLPFTKDSFDVVICSEVLEHVHKQHRAVSEIIRVLKPGKKLVVSVPRYCPERICWAFSDDYHKKPGGHIRIYRKKEIVSLLERRGLKMMNCHFAHSLHTPYWWLKCLVGPSRKDSRLVNLYHKFLIWDMMKRPRITRLMDKLFNPVLGKSIVLYFVKNNRSQL